MEHCALCVLLCVVCVCCFMCMIVCCVSCIVCRVSYIVLCVMRGCCVFVYTSCFSVVYNVTYYIVWLFIDTVQDAGQRAKRGN